jgi:hypothetical protein
MYDIFVFFYDIETFDTRMKTHFMDSSCACDLVNTFSQYENIQDCGLAVNKAHNYPQYHVTCCLWFLQQQLAKSEQCVYWCATQSVRYNPKEMIAGIHVRWTWWPPTPEAHLKLVWQDIATKQDIQDFICYMWAYIFLLEKCVQVPCFLNEQNYLIVHLLQVLLLNCGALH